MLTRLSNRLSSWAKGWLILALLAVLMVFNVVILPKALQQVQDATGSSSSVEGLDFQFFYTPEKAFSIISSYNASVRTLYRNYELTGDILTPILYSTFLSLLLTWLFRRGFAPGSNIQKLNVLPIAAGTCDVLENVCIVTMLMVYPAQTAAVAWFSTIFTMGKWSLLGISVLLVLIGLLKVAWIGFKRK